MQFLIPRNAFLTFVPNLWPLPAMALASIMDDSLTYQLWTSPFCQVFQRSLTVISASFRWNCFCLTCCCCLSFCWNRIEKMWCEIFLFNIFPPFPLTITIWSHDFVLCKQKFQKVSMCKVFKWTLLNICSVVELCTWNSNTKKFPFFFCYENVNIKMLK
jgi:hypothetical protein